MNKNTFNKIKFNRKTRVGMIVIQGEYRIEAQHINAGTFTIVDENGVKQIVPREQIEITTTGFEEKPKKQAIKTCGSCNFEPTTMQEKKGITCTCSPEPETDENGDCNGWCGKGHTSSNLQHGTGNQTTYSEVR